ncbi:hypothetical protein HanPSC8_Chr06g0243351 [Helianthus annuus]|nr:hypothetical protein HanPSC8_Chr06g0243351 [Helianthus annuus]
MYFLNKFGKAVPGIPIPVSLTSQRIHTTFSCEQDSLSSCPFFAESSFIFGSSWHSGYGSAIT